MIFSMECNCDSLAWLPGAHGVNEKLQRGEIPILDELDGGVVLKIPVGSIEKDAGIRLVSSVELKQGHPDPIKTAEFCLQAAGIGRAANAGGSSADGLRNDCYRNIEFTRDSTRVQAACLRIEQARFHSRKSMSSGHKAPLTSIILDRKSFVKVALQYRDRCESGIGECKREHQLGLQST